MRNKARPEGSIAEAHISYESLTFCSMYLHDVETTFNRPERNQQGSEPNAKISVFFSQRVRPTTGKGLMVELSDKELELANWFIFNNCDEIEGFRKYVISTLLYLLAYHEIN